MKKNYVLDTNVLLYDPHAIFKFEDNDVIIPIFVIEEVDQFKREGTERGRNARTVCRFLDELRDKGGSLAKGVALDGGGTLRVAVPVTRPELASALDKTAQDQAILQTAIVEMKAAKGRPTVFVTMDTNLRIRADALGVATENYENQRVDIDSIDRGIVEVDVEPTDVDRFFHEGQLAAPPGSDLTANLCVLLRDKKSPTHTALGRYHADRQMILPLRVPAAGIMGVRPKNKEQTFALELLLDNSIRLVTVLGKAGTGKTLLALACGLKRVVDDEVYTRLLVSRPVIPLGRDVGFLPGDIEEKLNPWMQPIFDNLEFLYQSGNKEGSKGEKAKPGSRNFVELLDRGQLQVEPLTYIRGRSLPHQYLIVDEAQNLTPHEVKTIITRCGEGTKIVLTGDPHQIDNPYVDSTTNGLTVVAHRFKGQPLAAHVVLSKGERSELADVAANLLLARLPIADCRYAIGNRSFGGARGSGGDAFHAEEVVAVDVVVGAEIVFLGERAGQRLVAGAGEDDSLRGAAGDEPLAGAAVSVVDHRRDVVAEHAAGACLDVDRLEEIAEAADALDQEHRRHFGEDVSGAVRSLAEAIERRADANRDVRDRVAHRHPERGLRGLDVLFRGRRLAAPGDVLFPDDDGGAGPPIDEAHFQDDVAVARVLARRHARAAACGRAPLRRDDDDGPVAHRVVRRVEVEDLRLEGEHRRRRAVSHDRRRARGDEGFGDRAAKLGGRDRRRGVIVGHVVSGALPVGDDREGEQEAGAILVAEVLARRPRVARRSDRERRPGARAERTEEERHLRDRAGVNLVRAADRRAAEREDERDEDGSRAHDDASIARANAGSRASASPSASPRSRSTSPPGTRAALPSTTSSRS